jgi:hypothetical protein
MSSVKQKECHPGSVKLRYALYITSYSLQSPARLAHAFFTQFLEYATRQQASAPTLEAAGAD